MDKKQVEKRIKELRKIVEYHAKKYYDEDKPEISDFEYDMMMLELRALESQYPELISKTSLTQKVGGNLRGYQEDASYPRKEGNTDCEIRNFGYVFAFLVPLL